MRSQNQIICFLFNLFLISLGSINSVYAQVLWSELSSRTESLSPLPTDEEVEAERLLQIEASKPKPLIKVDIPQRVEKITDNMFMVLPREAPLPTGTISGGFFVEESGEEPEKLTSEEKKSENKELASSSVENSQTPVLLLKEGGGYEVRTVQKQLNQAITQKQKAVWKDPKIQVVELFYDMDLTLPENGEVLTSLKEKLSELRKVKYVQAIISGEMPKLIEGDALALHRTDAIQEILGLGDEVSFQTVLLHELGRQRVILRVVY